MINTLTDFSHQIKNILFYPFTLSGQAYSLITAGTGAIRAALLKYRSSMMTIFYPPPPPPPVRFPKVPREMLDEIMQLLDACTRNAFVNCSRRIRKRYTAEERADLILEAKYVEIINMSNFDGFPLRTSFYRKLLTCLLDPQRSDRSLGRISALADKFCRDLPHFRVSKILARLLRQQASPGLQQQWERLARINLHFCVSLSGIMTRQKLTQYGVNSDFLLAMLSADLNQANSFFDRLEIRNYRSALHCVARKGFLSFIPALLQNKPDRINIADHNGTTVLIDAARSNDVERVRQLLQYGANVNLQDNAGQTALDCACHGRNKDMVEVLLSHGAQKEAISRAFSLHCRLSPRKMEDVDIEILQLLLSHGADVNWQNALGTALIRASEEGNITIVQLLLQHGADLHAEDDEGDTALSLAERAGRTDIVRLLKNRHQISRSWMQVIQTASQHCYAVLCRYLPFVSQR